MKAPIWTGVVLVPIAALGAIWPRTADERTEGGVRLAVLGPVLGILLVAAMFGNRLEPRYLMASVVALLPWAGAILPRGTEALLLWPTAALLTQVAAMRARLDPEAEVPDLPVVEQPEVDAQALFDESSTREATALRRKAFELAETLPEGERVEVERRPHGREGEMVWPLRVLRPDLKIEVVDP